MFTGIIETVGRSPHRAARRECALLSTPARSVSTMSRSATASRSPASASPPSRSTARSFAVDVSVETLAHARSARSASGAPVNLEKALRLSDRLGGHLVAGHVDGVGAIVSIEPTTRARSAGSSSCRRRWRAISHAKGSICIDGTSLTVNEVDGETLRRQPDSAYA